MNKKATILFAAIIVSAILCSSAYSADTTWASRNQPKTKKTKTPVNLYVPTGAEASTPYNPMIPNQQYGAQFNFGQGGQSAQSAQWGASPQNYDNYAVDAQEANSPYNAPYSAPESNEYNQGY